jgi:hypothetical protein
MSTLTAVEAGVYLCGIIDACDGLDVPARGIDGGSVETIEGQCAAGNSPRHSDVAATSLVRVALADSPLHRYRMASNSISSTGR